MDTVAGRLTGKIFTEPFGETFLVRTDAAFHPLESRSPYHLAHSDTTEVILLHTQADTCTSVYAAQIKPLHSPPFPGNKSKWGDKIEQKRKAASVPSLNRDCAIPGLTQMIWANGFHS